MRSSYLNQVLIKNVKNILYKLKQLLINYRLKSFYIQIVLPTQPFKMSSGWFCISEASIYLRSSSFRIFECRILQVILFAVRFLWDDKCLNTVCFSIVRCSLIRVPIVRLVSLVTLHT